MLLYFYNLPGCQSFIGLGKCLMLRFAFYRSDDSCSPFELIWGLPLPSPWSVMIWHVEAFCSVHIPWSLWRSSQLKNGADLELSMMSFKFSIGLGNSAHIDGLHCPCSWILVRHDYNTGTDIQCCGHIHEPSLVKLIASCRNSRRLINICLGGSLNWHSHLQGASFSLAMARSSLIVFCFCAIPWRPFWKWTNLLRTKYA